MDLWTQRIAVSFRRTLRFYEHRFELLRAIEENHKLQDFRVEEDRVAVRLGDANHQIAFSSNGLEASLLQPTGDEQRVQEAVRTICDTLAPERIVRPNFSFQWLAPLDMDYDSARKAAAHGLLAEGSLSLTDFALIGDGQSNEPDAVFRLECGVLQASEIPPRLARAQSSLVRVDPETPPSLWPLESLPEIAFYSHTTWRVSTVPDALSADQAVFHLWEGTREASHAVMSQLMQRANLVSAHE